MQLVQQRGLRWTEVRSLSDTTLANKHSIDFSPERNERICSRPSSSHILMSIFKIVEISPTNQTTLISKENETTSPTYFEVGVVLGIPVGNGRDAVGEVLPRGEGVEALSADESGQLQGSETVIIESDVSIKR